MKFTIKANVIKLKKNQNYEFEINYINKEEILQIALTELKIKIIEEAEKKDNLSLIPKDIKFNFNDNTLIILAHVDLFDKWVSENYDIL
tara:strand:- start:649 stop:915 length:267 start_codon:yes stop_codon:yes gene_type:complete